MMLVAGGSCGNRRPNKERGQLPRIARNTIHRQYKYNTNTNEKWNLGDPELLLVFHHISQYGTPNEDLPKKMMMILFYDLNDDEDKNTDDDYANDDDGDDE